MKRSLSKVLNQRCMDLHCIRGQRRPGARLCILICLVIISTVVFSALSACVFASGNPVGTPSSSWQEEFDIEQRQLAHSGEAKYFNLKPGFQIVLASQDSNLTITVLDETRVINGITTRVVEEREEINGKLAEVAHNYFAIDSSTGDVFYFGEEVDFYRQDVIVGHSGAWIAYEKGNKPGLIMPGTPKAGMKYYQELAPGVAMDRAKIISISENFKTEAGEFSDCLITQESSKISPTDIEYKTYCPGIGIVQDQSMILKRYGFVKKD